MHDLVIRRGIVINGTGQDRRNADVAVEGDTIAAIGDDIGPGRREIDADGLIVTPGFVDIHTHYDGQATWDSQLAPSSLHGVTTVVIGNCGVGFAPVRPGTSDFLINLMEGIEDILGGRGVPPIAGSVQDVSPIRSVAQAAGLAGKDPVPRRRHRRQHLPACARSLAAELPGVQPGSGDDRWTGGGSPHRGLSGRLPRVVRTAEGRGLFQEARAPWPLPRIEGGRSLGLSPGCSGVYARHARSLERRSRTPATQSACARCAQGRSRLTQWSVPKTLPAS